MTYDAAVAKAVADAGDAYAVIGCRNVGDAASPVLVYNRDGSADGTQWQSATLGDAEEWAMNGMVGVLVVRGYYDNEERQWAAEIRRVENE